MKNSYNDIIELNQTELIFSQMVRMEYYYLTFQLGIKPKFVEIGVGEFRV